MKNPHARHYGTAGFVLTLRSGLGNSAENYRGEQRAPAYLYIALAPQYT